MQYAEVQQLRSENSRINSLECYVLFTIQRKYYSTYFIFDSTSSIQQDHPDLSILNCNFFFDLSLPNPYQPSLSIYFSKILQNSFIHLFYLLLASCNEKRDSTNVIFFFWLFHLQCFQQCLISKRCSITICLTDELTGEI